MLGQLYLNGVAAAENGLKIYDIEEGKGRQVEKGTRLQVLCAYRC